MRRSALWSGRRIPSRANQLPLTFHCTKMHVHHSPQIANAEATQRALEAAGAYQPERISATAVAAIDHMPKKDALELLRRTEGSRFCFDLRFACGLKLVSVRCARDRAAVVHQTQKDALQLLLRTEGAFRFTSCMFGMVLSAVCRRPCDGSCQKHTAIDRKDTGRAKARKKAQSQGLDASPSPTRLPAAGARDSILEAIYQHWASYDNRVTHYQHPCFILPAGARDSILESIYEYWAAKRKRWQKPLMRRLRAPTSMNDNNPHNTFRPRERVNRPQARFLGRNEHICVSLMASLASTGRK